MFYIVGPVLSVTNDPTLQLSFLIREQVKKQQLIYGPLTEDISSNAIHALTIKAYTPDDWQKQKHFI